MLLDKEQDLLGILQRKRTSGLHLSEQIGIVHCLPAETAGAHLIMLVDKLFDRSYEFGVCEDFHARNVS